MDVTSQRNLPTPMDALCDDLQTTAGMLFPLSCAVSIERYSESTNLEGDFPGEIEGLEQAVPKRKQEFFAGRRAARAALASVGVFNVAIPRCRDRSPQWPREIVGSISHASGVAIAVVGPRREFRGLGVDIERDRGVKQDWWPLLFSENEMTALASMPRETQARWATVVFSAKEAFYKSQSSFGDPQMDFTEAEIRIGQTDGTFSVATPHNYTSARYGSIEFFGRFSVTSEFVVTGICAINASPNRFGLLQNPAVSP